MKYEFFVIKPRTSTKAEEVNPGIEVTQIKCFVMCHATSKHNLQVILARGGWVETHPRHSQVVPPGIVHVSRSIARGFFSLPREWYRQLLMKENHDRVSALRATSSFQKVENYFLLFYAVPRWQTLILSKTQTLGRRGAGSCPLLKSWVKLFYLHINLDHSSTS